MTFQRRFDMWLRVTYLDRWTSGLIGMLVVMTLLRTAKAFTFPILGWSDFTENWLVTAVLIAGGYGYWRVRHFHPLANLPYGAWLFTQPWIYPQPLPMGPWHLVWQDVLFVLLLSGVAAIGGHSFPLYFDTSPLNCALIVVATFFTAYSLASLFTAALCHEKYASLGIPLLYASILWVWEYPRIVAALVVGAVLLAHFSTRRMLLNFHTLYPWRAAPTSFRYSLTLEGNGWPYDYIHVSVRRPVISIEQALLVSVVAGWCAATVAHIPHFVSGTRQMSQRDYVDLVGFMWALLLMFTIAIVITRTVIYFRGMRMPISLAGRIATGQWIIPRFDVAIAPLALALLCGTVVPYTLAKLRVPIEVLLGVPVFLTLLVVLGMGPTLHDWWHAGDQRIVFQKKKQTTYVSTQ